MVAAALADRIVRAPRPHDAGPAARDRRRSSPTSPAPARELLAGAAGCSTILAGLMRREADWLRAALAEPPEAAMAAILAAMPAEGVGRARRAPPRRQRRAALADRARRPRRRLGARARSPAPSPTSPTAPSSSASRRSSPRRSPAASSPASPSRDPRGRRHVRARHGQDGRARAQLLVRHRPDRALRRDPPRPGRLRRAPPRLHPRDPAPGQAALRGHRRGLRLPRRPAPAPRPLGDAGLHRHRAGRALLRERRPHLGARRLHQGPPLRRRDRRRRRASSSGCAPSSGAATSTSPRSRTPRTCASASAPTRA